MLSDRELIEVMRSGDERGLTSLHRRYAKVLFVVAAKRMGTPEDAEEIVLDVFYNLWRNRETFELEHENLRGYLTAAVANQVLKALHKRQLLKKRQEEHITTVDPLSSSVELDIISKELQQRLETTINHLPEQCKLVFKLHHEARLSRKEIAERLNISENTVKYHLKRANQDVRKSLKMSGFIFPILFSSDYIITWIRSLQ